MPNRKERSRFVSAQMRANTLANAEKYDWVRQQQERAVAAAEAGRAADRSRFRQALDRALRSAKG